MEFDHDLSGLSCYLKRDTPKQTFSPEKNMDMSFCLIRKAWPRLLMVNLILSNFVTSLLNISD